MASIDLEDSQSQTSDGTQPSATWESSQSTQDLPPLHRCFSPPPPFKLPPFDPSRIVQLLPNHENVEARQFWQDNDIQENRQLFLEPFNDSLTFLKSLILRQEKVKVNRLKSPIPKDILEFAFEKYSLSSARLRDEVIFQAFELFRCFDESERTSRGPRPKEVLAASLLLASKIDNVRHISVKTLIEFGGLSLASYPRIIETETKLFLSLNGLLEEPTALSFIRAYFTCDDNDDNLLPQAYHLAVYILALNMMDADLLTLTAQDLGQISAWLVILILDLKLSPKTIALRASMGEGRFSAVCHRFLKTALQSCHDSKSPLNRHFATDKRSRVMVFLLTIRNLWFTKLGNKNRRKNF